MNEVKQRWEPIQLDYVGKVADVVQGGGGKLSVDCGDPGDPNSPQGQVKRDGGCKP